MKKILPKYICMLAFIVTAKQGISQDNPPSAASAIFTADSLASGNTKDILTSFFQLAFQNLTGKRKEFNFNSNPFAVMLKNNPKLNIDKYYTKYQALRKLNFGFSIGLDSSYHFNGFSSGIKYSIIDQRDPTTSKLLFTRLKIDGFADERAKLNKALVQHAKDEYNASAKTDADFQHLSNFRDSIAIFFNIDVPYNKLNAGFRKIVDSIVKEEDLKQIRQLIENTPASSLKSNDTKIFDSLKNSIKKNLLWTIGLSDTTYKDQFLFSNLVINSELSKGIFEPKAGANNLELNIKAACNFLKDTLQTGRNLKKVIFSFEPGVNWVIRDKNNDKSYLELKLSGAYYHNFNGLYLGEDRDKIFMNSTIRIRVYEDIWVPLEIKYDPANGNVFGLFNVKANFTGLGKLLKGISL